MFRTQDQAMEIHGQDLQAVRTRFDDTTAQVKRQNESSLQELKNEHAAALEDERKQFTKQISNLNLDLKATQDDLTKSKAAADGLRSEVSSLKTQLDAAKQAMSDSSGPSAAVIEEMERLTKELAASKDDLAAMAEMLSLTKTSLEDMSHNHSIELEEAAKAKAEELSKLRSEQDEQLTELINQKSELQIKLSDMDGEMSTLKATLADPPTVPKTNGSVPASSGVSKEDLQRVHEAHNLKMNDMQAEYDKALRGLKEELEKSRAQAEELQDEIARKAMEIQMLEADQDETRGEIERYVRFVRFFGGKGFFSTIIALVVIYLLA